jgi:DNA-binding MarR family transcriptional regulator
MAIGAPPVDLAMLLELASRSLQAELADRLAAVGLSVREQCVLSKASSGEYSQIQLAQMAELDKTTMVTTMDRLEAAGLAERRPSTTDRRQRIVAVTDAGISKAHQGDAIIEGVYRDVLGALPEQEREPFVSALSRLVGGGILTDPAECEHKPRRRRANRTGPN